MSKIKLHGQEVNTSGSLPQVGATAENFTLVAKDLSNKSLSEFKGKNVILNIFPSIDTSVCAASVRNFNKEAANLENTEVLCISKDLPFAQERFCGAEGLQHVTMLSDFRSNFAGEYGVQMTDGALAGLMSRAVVVINSEGKIVHTQQVDDIAQEPDYQSALNAVK